MLPPPLRRLLPALALLLAACAGDDGSAAATPPAGAAGSPGAAAAADSADPRVAAADSARIRGLASAPVWVIEVSDYQCPFCKRWHDEVFPALEAEFVQTGRVRFAYVHHPLPNHAHARTAAEAAMCAGAQGAFWPYHERIFDAQPRLAATGAADSARALFAELAAAQGLDAGDFAQCVDDGVMRAVVEADLQRSRAQLGVNATPTFVVGDQLIEGAQPIEVFRQAIEAAAAAAPTPPAPTR